MAVPRSGRRYTVLDVFTSTPLEGNALAVVHDADGVDADTMLRFARETRLSETTFVQSPGNDEAHYRNRIFTITGEIPFAGHPSLGTAVAVARLRGEERARYVQETGAGLQPIEVCLEDTGAHASMLQNTATFEPPLDPEPVMRAAGLEAGDAAPDLPPQLVSTGLPTLIAPLRDRAALDRLAPDLDALARIEGVTPHANFYLAHCDPAAGRARARMFTALLEGGEDPATGSAAGPLCAYLHRHAGCERVEISQGVEMGRPSRLLASVEEGRVRVGGNVVVVVEGSVFL